MLFGNAHIKAAIRMHLRKPVKACTGRHGGGDGDDSVIFVSGFDQALGKDIGVRRRIGLGFGLGAGNHIKGGDAVIFVIGGFGGRIAFALLRHHMHQHGAGFAVAHIFQNRQQMVEIVTIDGADIIKSEFFEQGSAGPETARIFFRAFGLVVEKFRQMGRQLFGGLANTAIGIARHQASQIGGHRACGRGNRHVIVIENDDQARMHGPCIVHGFIGHASRHGAIANHRNHGIVAMRQIAGDGHAQSG